MTAEIVNLRRFRKAKGRAEKTAAAAGNRAVFGRTKVAKVADEANNARQKRELDQRRLGHLVDTEPTGSKASDTEDEL